MMATLQPTLTGGPVNIIQNLSEFEMNATKFALEVEKHVKETGSNYLEAVCHVCSLYELDVQSVPKFLTQTMREKIEVDADKLHLLKR
jgi:hypothetical protein